MSEGANQDVTPDELRKVRTVEDFDLLMLISEIHDHGWPVARETLALMPEKHVDEPGLQIQREDVRS